MPASDGAPVYAEWSLTDAAHLGEQYLLSGRAAVEESRSREKNQQRARYKRETRHFWVRGVASSSSESMHLHKCRSSQEESCFFVRKSYGGRRCFFAAIKRKQTYQFS